MIWRTILRLICIFLILEIIWQIILCMIEFARGNPRAIISLVLINFAFFATDAAIRSIETENQK